MKYKNTVAGKFISRPNRFIAIVEIDGLSVKAHVKNTGKLGELLLPGADIILQKSDDKKRKTEYDLISVYRYGLGWVNIDSQMPNKLVHEWLLSQSYDTVKPEYSFGSSRIDFYMEKDDVKHLLEVKGCTLERYGYGLFPDAVSERAARHERELAAAVEQGYRAATAFVIAMNGVSCVLPNSEKDPKFAEALNYAHSKGVDIWYFTCRVESDSIEIINCEQIVK